MAPATIHCVHEAGGEQTVREHAEKAGLPANRITPISAVIAPATADD